MRLVLLGLVLLLLSGWPLPPAAAAATADVRLMEVMANPTGTDDAAWPGGEWVEVSNLGEAAADLSGWYLEDAANNTLPVTVASIVAGSPAPNGTLTLPAGGTWQIARDGASFAINNGAETLRLRDADHTLIDEVSWTSATENRTLSRRPDTLEWLDDARPTPGELAPIPGPIAAVHFMSVMPAAASGRDHEAFEIANHAEHDVSLEDWKLVVGSSNTALTGTIPHGSQWWLADDAAQFTADSGEVAIEGVLSTWRTLPNDGGTLRLVDQHGRTVDTVAWGDAETSELDGWSGPPVELVRSGNGLILLRGDACGAWNDSDADADWAHRTRQLGMSRFCDGGWFNTSDGSVRAVIHPDGAAEAVLEWIDGAQTSLRIHLYQLTHPHIVASLEAALQRGVSVRLVLEEQPLTSHEEHAKERAVLDHLDRAGAMISWFGNPDGEDAIPAPYRFIHSKSGIRDGTSVWLGTENWKTSAFPLDGADGNRGLSLIVESTELASVLGTRFDFDEDLARPHVLPWDASDSSRGAPPDVELEAVEGVPQPDGRTAHTGPISGRLVTCSDDCAWSIVDLIDGANTSIDLLLASLALEWELGQPSILVEALARAAERGVRLRLILDAAYLGFDEQDIRDVVDRINGWNATFGWDTAAILYNPPDGVSKVHAKTILVDERWSLVGSMNWNPSSMMRNREYGVILDHPALTAELGASFELDWASADHRWDTDDDGLSDGWEVAYGFDRHQDEGEAEADPDQDGLTNLLEAARGTDPRLADTDGDCIADPDEDRPIDDPDGDGLPSALDSDANGNGVNDGIETDCGAEALDWDDDGSDTGGRSSADDDGLLGPPPLATFLLTLVAVLAAAGRARSRRPS